jgi:hypothetical protein
VVATDIPEIVSDHLLPNLTDNRSALAALAARLDAAAAARVSEVGASGGDASACVGTVEGRELTWGVTDLKGFGNAWDLVVASDVIYRCGWRAFTP